MLKHLYKRILKKLNLSPEQLETLSDRFTAANICSGKFVHGEKACPNTTALTIKLDERGISSNEEARQLLRRFGVSRLDLALFYLLFDVPALVTGRVSEKELAIFRTAIKELQYEQTRI